MVRFLAGRVDRVCELPGAQVGASDVSGRDVSGELHETVGEAWQDRLQHDAGQAQRILNPLGVASRGPGGPCNDNRLDVHKKRAWTAAEAFPPSH